MWYGVGEVIKIKINVSFVMGRKIAENGRLRDNRVRSLKDFICLKGINVAVYSADLIISYFLFPRVQF